MAADNPKVPDTWITLDTIKTISGAAICAWLITLFFDLVIFSSMNDDRKQHAVTITAAVASLGFAIYRIISSTKKEKMHWITALPNAFLIYIHALGFQVSTKEIASSITDPATKSSQTSQLITRPSKPAIAQAGFNFLSFLTRQTSWLPDIALSRENKQLKMDNDSLQINIQRMKIRTEELEAGQSTNNNIKSLNDRIKVLETAVSQARDSMKRMGEKGVTGTNDLVAENRRLNATVTRLNGMIDSLNNLVADLRAKLNGRNNSGIMVDSLSKLLSQCQSRGNILAGRIREFNSLQQQWVQKAAVKGSAQTLSVQMLRTMDELVSKGYYKKLFSPIKTD